MSGTNCYKRVTGCSWPRVAWWKSAGSIYPVSTRWSWITVGSKTNYPSFLRNFLTRLSLPPPPLNNNEWLRLCLPLQTRPGLLVLPLGQLCLLVTRLPLCLFDRLPHSLPHHSGAPMCSFRRTPRPQDLSHVPFPPRADLSPLPFSFPPIPQIPHRVQPLRLRLCLWTLACRAVLLICSPFPSPPLSPLATAPRLLSSAPLCLRANRVPPLPTSPAGRRAQQRILWQHRGNRTHQRRHLAHTASPWTSHNFRLAHVRKRCVILGQDRTL